MSDGGRGVKDMGVGDGSVVDDPKTGVLVTGVLDN